jgi:hypothetical protein
MTVLVWQARASFQPRPGASASSALTDRPVPSLVSNRSTLLLLAGALASLLGCSGSPEPKAENHACFRALDCRAGLVCVEGRCTADLTPIVPEGMAATAPATPSGDAGVE